MTLTGKGMDIIRKQTHAEAISNLKGKGLLINQLQGDAPRINPEESLTWPENWDDLQYEKFLSGDMNSEELATFLKGKQIFKRSFDLNESGTIYDIMKVWKNKYDEWQIFIKDPVRGSTDNRKLDSFYKDLLNFDSNRRLVGLYNPLPLKI